MNKIKPLKIIILVSFIQVLSFTVNRDASAENKWFVSIYFGQASDNRFQDIAGRLDRQFIDSYMAAFSAGKELYTYKDYIRLEAEGQIARHWNIQSHSEVNAQLIIRWLPFFWDDYLDTSLAFGEGLSYATEIPLLETDECDETSNLLNYLMLELSFNIPQKSSWDIFSRIHHRSGVFGLFNNVTEGSNVVCIGLRRRL